MYKVRHPPESQPSYVNQELVLQRTREVAGSNLAGAFITPKTPFQELVQFLQLPLSQVALASAEIYEGHGYTYAGDIPQ